MSFPAYPSYKDSGIEWLGQIPESWSAKRLRRIAKLNPSKSEISQLDSGAHLTFLPMESIGDDGNLSLDRTRPLSEVESGYTYFREDDVAIAKITPCFENGKGAVMRGLTGGAGFGTTELIVVRPNKVDVSSEYLHLIFTSIPFRQHGEASMYGAGGQKRVPDDFVRDFELPLPPIWEQSAIAKFLNYETAKICALIDEQEKLISLLSEKRSAVIFEAVTKGLDASQQLKQSQVNWIGAIPTHWQVKRLRYICSITTGNGDTIDASDGGEFDFFVRSQTIEKLPTYTHECEAILTAGDGVGVGKVFHYTTGKFSFHQRVYMMSGFDGVMGKFLFHFMKENFGKVVLDGGAKSTVDSLRRPMFLDFPVSVPPLDEQQEICDYISCEENKFDALIDEAKKSIELLMERKFVLIASAVTGKIDVRGFVAPPVQ